MIQSSSVVDLSGVLEKTSVKRMLKNIEAIRKETESELQVVIVDQITKLYYDFVYYDLVQQLETRKRLWREKQRQQRVEVEIEIGKRLNDCMYSDWCDDTLHETTLSRVPVRRWIGIVRIAQRLLDIDQLKVFPFWASSVSGGWRKPFSPAAVYAKPCAQIPNFFYARCEPHRFLKNQFQCVSAYNFLREGQDH